MRPARRHHGSKRGSLRRNGARTLSTFGVAVASLLVWNPPASAAPIPPCRNYQTNEQFGRVTIDLRPDTSGAQTVLTVWWFVYGDPVGPYTFRHFVNGHPVGGLQPVAKNDNLHAALRMTENNGKTINWHYGDIYHFEGHHYAPAERAEYVTPVNQCQITPR